LHQNSFSMNPKEDYRQLCERFVSFVGYREKGQGVAPTDSQLCDLVQQVAGVPVYKQKDNQSLWIVFFESDVISHFFECLKQFPTSHAIQNAVLSSLSLLLQNIHEKSLLIGIVSKDSFKQILEFSFDLNNEEVASHFVDLLKATTSVLDEEILAFLYDPSTESFPLYQLATQLVDHPEHMVSTNARLVTLQIYQLQGKELEKFLQNSAMSNEFLQRRIDRILSFSNNIIDFWKEEREEEDPSHLSSLWTHFIEHIEFLLDLVLILEPRFPTHLLERLDNELIQILIHKIVDAEGNNNIKDPVFPLLMELNVVLHICLEKSEKLDAVSDYFFCHSSFCKEFKSLVKVVVEYMRKSSDEMIIYACSVQLEIGLNWFHQCLSRVISQNKPKKGSKSSSSSVVDQNKERPVPSIEHLWDRNELAHLIWTQCLERCLRKEAEEFLQFSWRCIRSLGRVSMYIRRLVQSTGHKRNIVKALLLQLSKEFSLPETAKSSYHTYSTMELLLPLAGPYAWKDLVLDEDVFHSQLLGSLMKDLNSVQCLLANKFSVDEDAAKYTSLYTLVRVFICIWLIDRLSTRSWLKDLRRLLSGQYRVSLSLEEFLRKAGILQEIMEEDISDTD